MPAAAGSSFDVAAWLIARARADGAPLLAVRLQRLLYLAQAHFAASTQGRRLMPALFVASRTGPVEPHLARVVDPKLAGVTAQALRKPLQAFMESIWQAFGALPDERLDAIVLEAPCVVEAMRRGPGAEIALAEMARQHTAGGADRGTVRVLPGRGRAGPAAVAKAPGAPEAKPGEGSPAIPRFHRGKPVTRWVPGQKREG